MKRNAWDSEVRAYLALWLAEKRAQSWMMLPCSPSPPAADSQDLPEFKCCCRHSPPTQGGGEMCHEVFLPLPNPLAPTLPPLVFVVKKQRSKHRETTLEFKHYWCTISLTRCFIYGISIQHHGRACRGPVKKWGGMTSSLGL